MDAQKTLLGIRLFFPQDQQEVLFWVLGSSVAAIFGVCFCFTLRLKEDDTQFHKRCFAISDWCLSHQLEGLRRRRIFLGKPLRNPPWIETPPKTSLSSCR